MTNQTDTFDVTLRDIFYHDVLTQSTGDATVRFRNQRVAQITGCTGWNSYATLFQQFKVLSCIIKVSYVPVVETKQIDETPGSVAVTQYDTTWLRGGVLYDATGEFAQPNSAAFELSTVQDKNIMLGGSASWRLPFYLSDAVYNNAGTAVDFSRQASSTPWLYTQTLANIDSFVRVRMGQLMVTNPILPAANFTSAANWARQVRYEVSWRVSFRGTTRTA